MSKLALEGGSPVRTEPLPYGRQWIDEADIEAVTHVLQSAWLTTGPHVAEFEAAFAACVGAAEAVAVSNGTAALHAAMAALDIGPGDEVIVPPITFAATANAVLYQGGTPVFADVLPESLLIDPAQVEARLNERTRAIIAVDYAGQPCDYEALRALASQHGVALVADACHALGARYHGQPVGSLADLSTFSFHPVKHITSGEGGMISTDNPALAQRMRRFRSHGIDSDHRLREAQGSWFYQMVELGYNYRLTDLQCVLGQSQLQKLPAWVERRQSLARYYDEAFAPLESIRPLHCEAGRSHAYHLYVVRLSREHSRATRADWFAALRAEGIGVNVHYVPVHLHPYYQSHLGTQPGLCPVAEKAYEEILTLPLFPQMSDTDAADVVAAVHKVSEAWAR